MGLLRTRHSQHGKRRLDTDLSFSVLNRMLLRDSQGSALMEFAIVLPILVVFVVGIFDFSAAFNQKQKIEQAAQEGAIIAGAQPMSDIYSTNPGPDSLLPVVTAIFNSLVGSGIMPTGVCTPPGSALHVSGLIWKYTVSGCPDNLVITIDRGWVSGVAPQQPPVAVGTKVTVEYPFHWWFNGVIQLLIPDPLGYTDVKESATAQNQM